MGRICIDPGHGATQDTDDFRVGPTGEREEWINLRVSLLLSDILKSKGHDVLLTRDQDVFLSLDERVAKAKEFKADCFLSVHHNSAAPKDPTVDYPIVFIGGNVQTKNSNLMLAENLLKEFVAFRKIPGLIVSDKVIYQNGLGLCRGLNGFMSAVVGEFSFFSHPEEELRLKLESHCTNEANCYARAIESFFARQGAGIQSACDNSPMIPADLWESLKQQAEHADKSWSQYLKEAGQAIDGKDFGRAIQDLETAIGLYPNHPQIIDSIGQLIYCLKATGQSDKADIFSNMAIKGYLPITTP